MSKKFMSRSTASRCPFPSAFLLATALSLALGGATASADDVKIGGFWIPNVRILDIADGEILYTNRGGAEIRKPLGELKGIKVEDIPEVEQAEAAFEKGDMKTARRAYTTASRKARGKDWLLGWIDFRMMNVKDRAGDLRGAVQLYQSLAGKRNPETFYLKTPPVLSVDKADTDAKKEAKDRLEPLISRLRGEAKNLVKEYVDRLKTAIGGEDIGADRAYANMANAGAASIKPTDPDIALLNDNDFLSDTITRKIAQGKFEAAFEDVNKALAVPSLKMSQLLYQKGMIQMAMARQADGSEKEKLYMDAGLSFARVITYFKTSLYAGPAYMELGAVHAIIGRQDKAREFYDRAALFVDEEDDKALADRLTKLLEELGGKE